jgi:2-isopropylmalate synthase
MGDAVGRMPETYELEYLHTLGGNRLVPTAAVRLRRGDQVIEEAASGDGMVDAACRAVDRATGMSPEMVDYSVRSVTGGKEALGEVVVRVAVNGHTVTGRAVATDVVEASARAYLHAINRWLAQSGAGESGAAAGLGGERGARQCEDG